MIAVKGRCTKCKKIIDIMDPGIVCSKCEKYYHGTCIDPTHNLKMLQNLVLHTKNWYCSKCIINVPQGDHTRTKEDRVNIQKKIDILFELRTILSMIDTSMSKMTDQCEELSRNAEELRTENNSLRRRIILHKIHGGESPKDFIDWHAKRKLLQIKDYTKPTKKKIPKSDEAIAKKNALFSYIEKNHNWKPYTSKREKTLSTPVIKHAIKHHRLGKQETAVFFSHVFISKVTQKWWHQCLLIIIIFLYTLIGAIIFYIIEGLLYELPLFYKVEKRRGELYGKLQEITQVVNNVLIENQLILNKTKNLLFDYFDFVQDIMNQYDDKATFQVEEMAWNFLGSIVFSATTCLTIGYGNIRPVTSIGKMLSVVYAVIGIPLFLILMATLGKTIITQLRKLLHKIRMCSRGCFLPKSEYGGNRSKSRATLGTLFIDFSEEEHPNLPLWLVFNLEVIYILIGTVIIIIFDIPDFLTAFCFTFESLTTIGFGAFVPGSNVFMIVFILYIIGGITVTVVCIHVAEDIYRNRLNFATRKLGLTTENYIERHLK